MVEVLFLLIGLAAGGLISRGRYRRLDQQLRKLLRDRQVMQPAADLAIGSQLMIELEYQKSREQRLETRLQAWEQTLKSAPIGYLQVDEENRLQFINPKACQLLNIPEPEAIASQPPALPRLLLEVVRSYELDALVEMTRHHQTRQQTEWLCHRVSADPSRINRQPPVPLRGYGVLLAWKQVGIFIEDRQETMKLAQQRDRWASDVAHELKTPLTSIRLVAETLRSRVDKPLVGWVDRLINETIRLSDLVQDLLDLSRLDGRNPEPLTVTRVNVADLIHRAWNNLEPLSTKKHIQFDYEGPESLDAHLDEPRIFRVLLNLLDNAIKHGPERSVIQICLSLQTAVAAAPDTNTDAELEPPIAPATPAESLAPPFIQIEVIDAGHGFQAADLPYVFDRFYRVDPARTRSPANLSGSVSAASGSTVTGGNSSGLGLAIVWQIVDAHQGLVLADNHPETGGGWLRVYLPVSVPQTTAPPPLNSVSSSHS